jgi:hypothetical protein
MLLLAQPGKAGFFIQDRHFCRASGVAAARPPARSRQRAKMAAQIVPVFLRGAKLTSVKRTAVIAVGYRKV